MGPFPANMYTVYRNHLELYDISWKFMGLYSIELGQCKLAFLVLLTFVSFSIPTHQFITLL